MPKIAVFDYRILPKEQQAIQELADNNIRFPLERSKLNDLNEMTGDAEIVLITPWEKVTKEYLDAHPNMKYIGLCGTSTANIDLEELEKRDIAFRNIVWHNKEGVAEFYFMYLVALARGVGEYQWKAGETHELVGKSIGIIGLGHVGQAFAHMALAYKMNVSYFSPHRKQEWEDKGVTYKEKADLVADNEILVVCSPTNVRVLDKPDFDLIKPGSILMQACGGTPFDADAFKAWVSKPGNFAVFEMSAGQENHDTYKDLPGVIFSDLVAGDTYESNQRRGRSAVENLKTYLASVT